MNKPPTTLIIGGCRSGKSRQALTLAEPVPAGRKWFLATCIPQDAEMRARVRRHQAERGSHWQTIEEPIHIDRALCVIGQQAELVIVDCLTLWITNLLLSHEQDDPILQAIGRLCTVLAEPPCTLILVTNEVGGGIVPENHLARRFRDLTGWANQHIAAACAQVIWMVAGIAIPIKPQPPGWAGKPQ